MAETKGIILYDFLAFLGGAERLILTLAQALKGVDLCVGYRKPFPAVDEKLEGLRCYDLGAESRIPAWRTVKLIRAFETRAGFISGYDWALFNGLADPAAVKHRPGGQNYLYCHSIPRLAYDLRSFYMAQVPVWQRPALADLAGYLRRKYEAAIRQMDVVVVNSENVKKRLRLPWFGLFFETSAWVHIKVAWLLWGLLAVSLSAAVWVEDWSFMWVLADFYLLGAIIFLGSELRWQRAVFGAAFARWGFLAPDPHVDPVKDSGVRC